MITFLSSDAYRGFSAQLDLGQPHAQYAFIGRVQWPNCAEAEESVIKLYQHDCCGVANEAIGYASNALLQVAQPRKGAVLILRAEQLPPIYQKQADFIDPSTKLVVCWTTSFEQNSKPFRYIRRLPSFAEKQATAFYKSAFCQRLTMVDQVTGNNDRHEGNFLYRDDLDYLAIDQGCIGGSPYWHRSFPDQCAINQLIRLAQENLQASAWAEWRTKAIIKFETDHPGWESFFRALKPSLAGLLESDQIDTILDYMRDRTDHHDFARACGNLL